jgi:hypothetical protein
LEINAMSITYLIIDASTGLQLGQPYTSKRVAEANANAYRFADAPVRCDVREHDAEFLQRADDEAKARRFESFLSSVASATVSSPSNNTEAKP